MKREIDYERRKLIENIMHGHLNYAEALERYPHDIVKSLIEFDDFREWVNENYNPSIIKLLQISGEDILLQIALRSPLGYLRLVLSSKKNYGDLLRIRPQVFFEICNTYFKDVIMEEIIRDSVEKHMKRLAELFSTNFSDETSRYAQTKAVMKILSTYNYWDTIVIILQLCSSVIWNRESAREMSY
jgi:hypothetical protein